MIVEASHTMTEFETLTPVVARFMSIDDITAGDPKKDYLVRYRGQIYGDTAEAYEKLAEQLRSLQVTPMFRLDQDRHAVLLLPGVIEPKPSNPLVNLVLFVLTLLSVVVTGAFLFSDSPPLTTTNGFLGQILPWLSSGLPYAASLMAILGAHEFGHYLVSRYHHTHASLPYFLPLPPPLSLFGTLGAFIQLKEPPRNKRILMDIGIAGPLAGLVVAIPVLLYGLSLSKVEPITIAPGQAFTLEGNSLLYLFAKFLMFGRLLPAPSSYGNLPPVLYWIRYFFTSQPLPLGGVDVMIHPIVWAGWAGLLVTAINLIPAGQLDGGHLMYVLLGKRTRALWPFILAILVLLGFVWTGWWLWAALIFFLGRIYAEPLDQITQLDPPRKVMAVLGIIIFFLVFTPVPLVQALAGGG
jgi:membrane-associated protease RseP (regulator of RpoE activity)